MNEAEKLKSQQKLDNLFQIEDESYNQHMQEWVNKCSAGSRIDKPNLFQPLSWNCYVHDKAYVDIGVKNVLQKHVDSENPKEKSHDILVGVWKTFYSNKLGRYVTMLATASLCKSVEYLLN